MSEVLDLEREAEALREEGKYDAAIEKLKQLLEKDESFVRAHLALAVVYHHTGDYERSVHHGEKAVELEPTDAFNYAALSITYQRAFEATRDPIYIQKAESARDRGHQL